MDFFDWHVRSDRRNYHLKYEHVGHRGYRCRLCEMPMANMRGVDESSVSVPLSSHKRTCRRVGVMSLELQHNVINEMPRGAD